MKPNPLIVGAGPVGLGAALFLHRAGISARIIDEAEKPSIYSKALAVNPRTLEILEQTGVTEKMLALGLPIRGGRFWQHEKVIGEMRFEKLLHKYRFMLALSQATTERLLNEALEAAGGKVGRGTRLIGCASGGDGVEARLERCRDGTSETVQCPWLFAADGAHSTVRHSLGINFDGSSFVAPWHLADLPLKTSLESNFAHVFLHDAGFVFLLRVIDDASSHSRNPAVWRVISNRRELLAKIPMAEIAGAPVWESDFHISHRINERLQAGNVYFAGDAAHIHSPMGARGMNLGLEDAWVFGELARRGQMNRYETLRKPVDQLVVNRVERLSRMVRADSGIARLARSLVVYSLMKFPPVYRRVVTVFTGLDHRLEPPLEQSSGSRSPEGEHDLVHGKPSHAHSS